jgi:hypothetical protein
VAGAQLGIEPLGAKPLGISRLAASSLHGPLLRQAGNIANSLPAVRVLLSTLRTSGFYGVPCWSAGSARSKSQVLNPDEYGITTFIPVQRQSVNSN